MTPSLDALNAHYDAMPPVAAMRIRAVAFDGERLQLHAPLAANVNDKDCAFGGSLASLMTLAGWGLLTLKLEQAGLKAEVYVADSQLRYLRPLYTDLHGDAALAPDVDWDAVLRAFRDRGRARASVMAWVHGPRARWWPSSRAVLPCCGRPDAAPAALCIMRP